MSRADVLLFRLSEVAGGKIKFGSAEGLKPGPATSLRKQSSVPSMVKKEVGETTEDNSLAISGGIGEFNGHPVIFLQVTKNKPYQPMVIARRAIETIASTFLQMALSASVMAQKKNIEIAGIVVLGNFSSGKETRRYRACVRRFATMVGGMLMAKQESDGQQMYIIGAR